MITTHIFKHVICSSWQRNKILRISKYKVSFEVLKGKHKIIKVKDFQKVIRTKFQILKLPMMIKKKHSLLRDHHSNIIPDFNLFFVWKPNNENSFVMLKNLYKAIQTNLYTCTLQY